MKLKGTSGIDMEALQAKSKELTRAYEEGKVKAQSLAQNAEVFIDAPASKKETSANLDALLLKKVLGDPQSRINMDRFPNLRKASVNEIQLALARFKGVDELDFNLGRVLELSGLITALSGMDKPADWQVESGHRHAVEALAHVQSVRRALIAAGTSSVVNGFPSAALDALEQNLKTDLGVLEKALPKKPSGLFSGGGFWSMPPSDPSADRLPKPIALRLHHVENVESAAKAIAARLKQPALEGQLLALVEAVGKKNGPQLQKLLGAFAVLVDEVVSAPDYTKGYMGPGDRSSYRARQHADWKSGPRQDKSRLYLRGMLEAAMAEKNPVGAIGEALVAGFLHEVGVRPEVSRNWKPQVEHVASALEQEAFLPLRAYVERGADSCAFYLPRNQVQNVVHEVVQSVVEGRYAEWRQQNAGSKVQLGILNAAQLEKFNERISVNYTLKDKADKDVQVKTREIGGESLEIFWATKTGGPSHGFDVSTNCALSMVINARNLAIVVDDPRWPQPAARTYLRLLSRPEDNQPVLFLEGPSLDFPYPRSLMLDLEKAVIQHAIQKAKAMGVPLAISGSISEAVESMGLAAKRLPPYGQHYVLGASLLLEAGSVFGPHDWPQQQTELRPIVKNHYVLEKPGE